MDKVSERFSLVGTVSPASQTVAAHDTDVFQLGPDDVAVFVILTGVLGTAATGDFSVYASDASAGTYAQVSSSSITQLVKASNDNNQVLVTIKGRHLPSGKTWVKGKLTIGAAASLAAVAALKYAGDHKPANDSNLTTVVQTLAV